MPPKSPPGKADAPKKGKKGAKNAPEPVKTTEELINEIADKDLRIHELQMDLTRFVPLLHCSISTNRNGLRWSDVSSATLSSLTESLHSSTTTPDFRLCLCALKTAGQTRSCDCCYAELCYLAQGAGGPASQGRAVCLDECSS